jgi:hypothetical protein
MLVKGKKTREKEKLPKANKLRFKEKLRTRSGG